MRYLLLLLTTALALAIIPAAAQPVVKADAVALLHELPAPPATLADAFQRAYPGGATRPDAKSYYQTSLAKLERVQLEAQSLLMQFYQKYPTGIPDMPKQPANRVSAKDKSAMEAATSELAQKMLTDKAFAQKFAQMSESEQHAYIAGLMADKGIKPVNGTPNTNDAPMPGTDMDWMTPCQAVTGPALDLSRWEKQTALQQKYAAQHDDANAWTEAEIKKLPMISFGEYGHDHDPEKVKAIRKQGLDKHCAVADAMMKEAAALFAALRQEAAERYTPLNDALKTVRYGETYSFGLNYTFVLQAQGMMLGDLQNVLTNEINVLEEVARWEFERRNFEGNR